MLSPLEYFSLVGGEKADGYYTRRGWTAHSDIPGLDNIVIVDVRSDPYNYRNRRLGFSLGTPPAIDLAVFEILDMNTDQPATMKRICTYSVEDSAVDTWESLI